MSDSLQFLGPAMQEEVLKLVLLALEEGSALSRKVTTAHLSSQPTFAKLSQSLL